MGAVVAVAGVLGVPPVGGFDRWGVVILYGAGGVLGVALLAVLMTPGLGLGEVILGGVISRPSPGPSAGAGPSPCPGPDASPCPGPDASPCPGPDAS